MIPEFMALIERIKNIHEKKNQDYAEKGMPFQNFDRSSEIASWFRNNSDKSYAVLIGTKLARLATLLNLDKEPNNESIQDSFDDLTTYCGLWGAHFAYRQEKTKQLLIQQTTTTTSSNSPTVENTLQISNNYICYECGMEIKDPYRIMTTKGPKHTYCPVNK